MVITSLENDKVKNLVRLQRKKYRDLTNTYLIEGDHLIKEADKAGVISELIILDGEECEYDYPITYVSLEVLKKISTLDSPAKIMAVCNRKLGDSIIGNKILFLDNIQDPGNLGTIIRSSVAFNVSTIILSSDSVDLYNPKVIRATQGIYNHINVIIMDYSSVFSYMNEKHIPVYGTSVVNGVDASSLSKDEKDSYCLIMGNEGQGVSSNILAMCDKNLYIKMNSDVESLNVGVACSILLYELGR